MAVGERAATGPVGGLPIILLRRYAPLLALLAAMALLATMYPSRRALLAGGGIDSGGGTDVVGGSVAQNGGTQPSGTSGTGGTALIGPGGVTQGSVVKPGQAQAPGLPPGDITHCVRGREFDPAIAYWAPACTPGTPGGLFPGNNGGATSMGVTGDTITFIDYVTEYGAVIDAILKAQGALVTYTQAQILDRAWENFINSHFVLFGRKVKIIAWQGKPNYKDITAMIAEMDQIVEQYHPFGFFWSTTVCTECYAELASKGVVTFGGLGFSDAFSNELAPYNYTAHESSTRMETAFAQWWCAQMSSVSNPSRTAKWAGNGQNPKQDFRNQPRVLGIISPSPPDNQDTIRNYMVPLLKQLCGEDVTHYYFYAQDVSTAAQQVAASVAAMDTQSNPATDVLCICDIVAPAFLYSGEQGNNYWPENLIDDASGMGWDTAARGTYEQKYDGSPTQGCANPAQGCEFDMAIGLSADGPQAGGNRSEGYKIYHLGGGKDPVAEDSSLKNPDGSPYHVSANEARVLANNWIMMASLIENTGPNLTPANMMAKSPQMASLGGGNTGLPLLKFSANSHQWTQDARIVYWNKHASSPYDSPPEIGTWTQMGPRYNLGQYPTAPSGPPAPTAGRSP